MNGLKRLGLAGILAAWLAGAAYGQYATQTIALSNGWNGIYLQVQPDDARCDAVFSNWPVASVNLFNMEQLAAKFTVNPAELPGMASDFLVWSPTNEPGVNSLGSLLGGRAYLIYATNTFTQTITGRPVVPRISWIPCGVDGTNWNVVGFACQTGAVYSTWLKGASFGKALIQTVGGTRTSAPTAFYVMNQDTLHLNPGQAYYVSCDKVSSYAGPVRVYPAGSDGVSFPSNSSLQSLRMVNEYGTNLTVTLSLAPSAPAPSGVQPTLPPLLYFKPLEGWTNGTGVTLTQTLEPNAEWTLQLAVDRTQMTPGTLYGGVFVCSDDKGGLVRIPVQADYAPANPSMARWPAGLWVGKASLNQVSQIIGNGAVNDGVTAGGTMELRLILHVDTNGVCRLLQRVIIAGAADTNGNWNAKLYVDESKVKAGVKSVRISSVAFGTKNNMGSCQGFGSGSGLTFNYVIAYNDPVNPLRHPYHPDHDGLDFEFKTTLPSGDDVQQYMDVIKPELFSFTNTISLAWTTNGVASWNPPETTSGNVTLQVQGIRKEGPVSMQGSFQLQRVSPIGRLTTQ